MPGAQRVEGPHGNPVYQVSGRSFVFFRTPRPDAVDPETGERLTDVIVFWVSRDVDKTALVSNESTPFFTTPHFDGHPSVLIQGSRLGDIGVDELQEIIETPGSRGRPRPQRRSGSTSIPRSTAWRTDAPA